MIRAFILFFIIVPNIVLASAKIQFEFFEKRIHQGSLLKAKIKINQDEKTGLQLQKIQGQSLGGVIYVNSVSLINGTPNDSFINGEASVIFLKIPASSSIYTSIDGVETEVTWSDVEVVPTEVPKNLLFGSFDIPKKTNFYLWTIISLILILSSYPVITIWRKWNKKRIGKKEKMKIKDRILSINTYQDVVDIWQEKHDLIRFFPHLEAEFKILEKVLFKHQFKPVRAKDDEEEVLNAYREFIDSIRGGFDGI